MPAVQPDELAKRLGAQMRAWREANDLTLEQAGARIGVDLQQWHRWESSYTGGSNPTLRSLVLIARAMDKDLPTLVADMWFATD